MASLNNMDSAKSNTSVVQLAELGNGVVQISMKDEENRKARFKTVISCQI